MTGSPSLAFNSFARSAVNAIRPVAAPGDAFKPVVMTRACFNASGLNCGCSNESNCEGSTFKSASFSVKTPSLTQSIATFNAA